MTRLEIEDELKDCWSRPVVRGSKIDWLRLECLLAAILACGDLTDSRKVTSVKEALDAITRGGYFGPEDYLTCDACYF